MTTTTSTTTTTTTTGRPLRLGLSALLLTLLAFLVPISSAQAHDRLTESDPAQDATLEQAPEVISLTFSGEVQSLGSSVDLVAADGSSIATGSPEGDGATVTAAVDGEAAAGDYEVRWRVVSADGHPISGAIPFTVEGEASPTQTGGASPSDESSPAESTPQESTPQESATAQPAEDAAADSGDGISPTMILTGTVLAAVLLGLLVALLGSRRRTDDRGEGETPAP